MKLVFMLMVICPFDHASFRVFSPALPHQSARGGDYLQESIPWGVFLMWITCNRTQVSG